MFRMFMMAYVAIPFLAAATFNGASSSDATLVSDIARCPCGQCEAGCGCCLSGGCTCADCVCTECGCTGGPSLASFMKTGAGGCCAEKITGSKQVALKACCEGTTCPAATAALETVLVTADSGCACTLDPASCDCSDGQCDCEGCVCVDCKE